MISDNPSLAEFVQLGIDAALANLFKAGPGIVMSYDPLTNTANVRPATLHAVYSTTTDKRSYLEIGGIPNVPIIFPRAGGKVARLPVNVGDTVLLVYCDTSLAEWRASGEVSRPQDARRHSIGWPVAIPGFFPDSKPSPALDSAEVAAGGAIFGEEDGTAKMIVGGTMPGVRFGQLAVSPVALSVPTDAALAGCMSAIAALTSSVSALIAAFNAHTHAVATTGTAAAQAGTAAAVSSPVASAPAAPGAPATTASTLVKSL